MSTDRSRVVCLDTVLIDLTLVIGAFPQRGGDSLASQRLLSVGGGFNMMSAARRQGASALYVGQTGRGTFADIARATLKDEGIAIALAASTEADLGVCVVLVDSSGERTFVTSPGAELSVNAQELAGVQIGGGDFVYLSGYNVLYPEVSSTTLSWLGTLDPDTRVAFDPGPRGGEIDPQALATVLGRSDWLLCNALEARQLSGEDDAARSALALRERWRCDHVVVRDGAAGCVSADDQGVRRAPGFGARVVDTNGAGDVHNGVVIAETLRGTGNEEVLLRANAAAAIAISSRGPATCPMRESVDEKLKSEPRHVVTL